jgi:PcaR/PcaU/PobR family beta-ketoadipate pathway transcriptional regulator
MAKGRHEQPPKDEILTRNPPRTGLDSNPLFVNSLAKGVRVLYAFGGNESRLTAAEIARTTGLDNSAVQRFIFSLRALGFLEKDERSKRYKLSARLLDFAYLYLRSDPLVAVAHPHLVQLSQAIQEEINLSILDQADVIYVARVLSREGRALPSLVGGRMPSFCTSNGRVLLAHLDPTAAARIVERSDRRPLTRDTLIEPALIMERVAEARTQGFSIVDGESEVGIVSVAVPILDADGRPLAAINTPLLRGTRTRAQVQRAILPRLKKSAEVIRRSLGAMSF